MTHQPNCPHNPSRPVSVPESAKKARPGSLPPHAGAGFRLALAALGLVLFGCMTVTRLVNGAASTPPAAQLPVFEHDYNKTLELIGSGQTSRLAELSAEGQQPPMYQAGTQKYTVSMAGSEIVDLGYDWCTKTGAILSDNMQHITVSVTINGYDIPSKDFQAIDWSVQPGQDAQFPEGLVCHSWVVLASQWPVGDYRVVETAVFDGEINDGYDNYGAGAYSYDYMVHVGGTEPSARGRGALASWSEVKPMAARQNRGM